MDVSRLEYRVEGLVAHMRKEGIAGSYIRTILTDVRWLERNGCAYDSFAEACEARMAETKSDDMRRRYRLSFGILRRYVEDGTLPDRRRQTPLFPRGACHELSGGFRSVVDSFAADARSRGLKGRTVMGRVSVASRFLLSMQGLGRSSLAEVTDSDAMGYFVGEDGTPRLEIPVVYMWTTQFRASDVRWDELTTREAMTGTYEARVSTIFNEPRFSMYYWEERGWQAS